MGMLLWIVEGHESRIASIKEDANVVPSFAHGAISCRRFLFRIVSTRFPNPTSVSAWGSNSCHGSAPAGLEIWEGAAVNPGGPPPPSGPHPPFILPLLFTPSYNKLIFHTGMPTAPPPRTHRFLLH